MGFPDLSALLQCFHDNGVERVLCKPLAENDNSKQQVYLGSSFSALNLIPFGDIHSEPQSSTFKTPVHLSWVNVEGQIERASGAQLILYPRYPEVRLSGFLRGCRIAPSEALRPVPHGQRRFNNGPDGRLLFLGIRPDKTVLAYLSLPGTGVTAEFAERQARSADVRVGVFVELPVRLEDDPKKELISRLKEIHRMGWHPGIRLDANGRVMPYSAQNGGGYTLEALFGIVPNGHALPDFKGWELKAFSGNRITLMTPEPDGGFYGANGVAAFLRQYGRQTDEDTLYFTGVHRIGETCEASGMTLSLRGFDANARRITDVSGGLDLIDGSGTVAAAWSFPALISHWGRKHALAAYVPYTMRLEECREYRFDSPALLGEGTDFALCLAAMQSGAVVYDPAPKLTGLSGARTRVKARSQFRVLKAALPLLYSAFDQEPL